MEKNKRKGKEKERKEKRCYGRGWSDTSHCLVCCLMAQGLWLPSLSVNQRAVCDL